jgi:accessory colonization factor AcfC
MFKTFKLLVAAILAFGVIAACHAQATPLKLYGPGGVDSLMKECAAMFEAKTGIKVTVTTGPESDWLESAKADGDLFFGGTESIMSEVVTRLPGVIDESTRTSIYDRGAGIVVRPGNPKQIRSLDDLAAAGIRLVDVTGPGLFGLLEDSTARHGTLARIQGNVIAYGTGGSMAVSKWKSNPKIDAWVTLEPWHYQNRGVSEFIPIAESERVYRQASIAVLARSKQRAEALEFIAFLKSEQAKAAFRGRGWRVR